MNFDALSLIHSLVLPILGLSSIVGIFVTFFVLRELKKDRILKSDTSGKEFDLVISADPLDKFEYFKELLNFKALGLIFAKRDFLVRFRHTAVGLAWVLLKPAMLVFTLSFVFGKLTGFDSKSTIPYPLLVLAGLIPWQFFAVALHDTTSSLVYNQHIITKTYFPRMLLPFGCLFNPLADLIISFLLFAILMLWYGVSPTWRLLILPGFITLLFSLCLGLGLWLSALNARFRDVQHLLPFFLQIGMYLSPVGYVFDSVPAKWQLLYNLNPLVGIIEGFRWCLLGGITGLHYKALLVSTFIAVLLIITGFFVFRKLEVSMVDKL